MLMQIKWLNGAKPKNDREGDKRDGTRGRVIEEEGMKRKRTEGKMKKVVS